MAERSIAAVLKTVEPKGSGGSNPSFSAKALNQSKFQVFRLVSDKSDKGFGQGLDVASGDAQSSEPVKPKYLLPRLFDGGGNYSSEWYIEFYCQHPSTQEIIRFKRTRGFNACRTLEEKYAYGNAQVAKYTALLENCWTPWSNLRKVYVNYLEYKRDGKKKSDPDHNSS